MILTISSTDSINWNVDGIGQIRNNVINILRTRLGEIPFIRGVGIDSDYIDAPLSESKGEIISDVIDNLQTFEPRVNVQSVDVNTIDSNGTVRIKVVIQI